MPRAAAAAAAATTGEVDVQAYVDVVDDVDIRPRRRGSGVPFLRCPRYAVDRAGLIVLQLTAFWRRRSFVDFSHGTQLAFFAIRTTDNSGRLTPFRPQTHSSRSPSLPPAASAAPLLPLVTSPRLTATEIALAAPEASASVPESSRSFDALPLGVWSRGRGRGRGRGRRRRRRGRFSSFYFFSFSFSFSFFFFLAPRLRDRCCSCCSSSRVAGRGL